MPREIKDLARVGHPRAVLELGCGVGRFSRYLARPGLSVTGVDFSAVAIAKAKANAARDNPHPQFLVADVTHLDAIPGLFDGSFDVGCFHCLDQIGRSGYAAEVHRLLRPGGTHLIWVMDTPPSGLSTSPGAMATEFGASFEIKRLAESRRRLVASHWYWLQRR